MGRRQLETAFVPTDQNIPALPTTSLTMMLKHRLKRIDLEPLGRDLDELVKSSGLPADRLALLVARISDEMYWRLPSGHNL